MNVFFNLVPKIKIQDVLSILGGPVSEGDSSNALEGQYYSMSIFGLKLRIEKNSYDFEDEFEYHIRLYKDVSLDVVGVENIELLIAKSIAILLKANFSIEVAYEVDDSLKLLHS